MEEAPVTAESTRIHWNWWALLLYAGTLWSAAVVCWLVYLLILVVHPLVWQCAIAFAMAAFAKLMERGV